MIRKTILAALLGGNFLILGGCQKTYEHSEPASSVLEERMRRDMDRIEGNSEVVNQNEDKRF